MDLLLASFLLLAGDPTPAGLEYTRGLQLLAEKKYDEAIRAIEEAIKYEPNEFHAFKYRDPEGRHRHPYYPYFFLGRARAAAAESEASLEVKRDRLQLAIRNLSRSLHSEAKPLAIKIEKRVAEVEEEIKDIALKTPPPEIVALDKEAMAMCDLENFEDALDKVESKSSIFTGFHVRQKDNILGKIRDRQRLVLRQYDAAIAARLESISRADPTLDADNILPLLKPACVPAKVEKKPAPGPQWLLDFYALYEKELDRVTKTTSLVPDQLLQSAAVFDQAGFKALDVGLYGGFRASRNLAQAMRLARARAFVDGGNPEEADYKSTSEALLAASVDWCKRVEENLRPRLAAAAGKPLEGELKAYLEKDLPKDLTRIEAVRGKLEEKLEEYKRRVAAETAVVQAQVGLFKSSVMAQPEECRKVEQELISLESLIYFKGLPREIQAQTLYTRAVSVAFSSLLEGESPARVAELCRNDVNRARTLDPKVEESWKDRLSPRIRAIFGGIK